ncbi:MAG: hypothetical protein OFPII_35030 [Osedax symbiont Rs1]|nr:MAG: hypothetical protein OFPII_35030 [Osedax symbiont Rs1]
MSDLGSTVELKNLSCTCSFSEYFSKRRIIKILRNEVTD